MKKYDFCNIVFNGNNELLHKFYVHMNNWMCGSVHPVNHNSVMAGTKFWNSHDNIWHRLSGWTLNGNVISQSELFNYLGFVNVITEI